MLTEDTVPEAVQGALELQLSEYLLDVNNEVKGER